MHRIGPVIQNAFVVKDIEVAIKSWSEALSIGPFFLQEHVKYRLQEYRGGATDPDLSLAFAYSGDWQIELVQQHNDAPGVYANFIESGRFGLHHLGILSDDIEADTAELLSRGYELVQRGVSVAGIETIYFAAPENVDTLVELIRSEPAVVDGYAAMRAASREWTGVPQIVRF